MKKVLLLLSLTLLFQPLWAQFKTVVNGSNGSAPRSENIGDVTNIREENPIDAELPETASFVFESIEKTSIELSNISNVKVFWTQEREIPLAIYGNQNAHFQEDENIEEKCYLYLESISDYLGVDDVRNRFFIREVMQDENDRTHVKMKQHYRGIPIYGGELIVHFQDGKPYFMNGYWFREIPRQNTNVTNRTNTDIKSIVKKDLQSFTTFRNLTKLEKELIGGQWTIEKVFIKKQGDGSLILVYKVTVHPNIAQAWEYFIDHESGTILKKYPTICKMQGHDIHEGHKSAPAGADKAWATDLLGVTRELNVYNHAGNYYLMDASRNMFDANQSSMPDDPVGVIWTLDAKNTSPENDDFYVEHLKNTNNSWTDKVAVSSHYNAQQAYNYYKNTFNRNSINGQGGNIISLINVVNADGTQMDNAFWSGKAMFYGNGKDAFDPLAGALDVAGHEMTHGVIQSTANLEYYGESGAINESFADIFGCMIDRDDWQLGEDVVFPHVFTSGALRDMSNPHNGGFSLNDIGFQPMHVNEQFFGSEDNAGVHINSGIPNHAFYLFAEAVGKVKAERIYYKALTSYLTKSSKFVDLRVAIEQTAYDMYGAVEKQAASNAFNQVGISGGSSGGNDYQNDLAVNPGDDFILFYDETWGNLVLGTANGDIIQDPFSTTSIMSKPSISDNGSEIVFVGQDRMIHYIYIDWSSGQYEENIIQNDPIWRNVVISKDGWRIAAITETLDNLIYVYDFGLNEWADFEIYNPTTVQGISAGDVDFIDVMEFNYSGEWIMYDAQNTIVSDFGNDIVYFDIGFVNVFENSNVNFASGLVQKLFSGLPENTSIGNPTFSKNSPYIIAFDYLIGDDEYYIVGSNLETGEVNQIYESISLGYPNYSRNDENMLFDFSSFFGTDLAVLGVGESKIDYVPNSDKILYANASWGVWFANGSRDLTLSDELILQPKADPVIVSPNPFAYELNVHGEKLSGEYFCNIFNMLGENYYSGKTEANNDQLNLDLHQVNLPTGQYFITLRNNEQLISKKIQVLRY